MKVSPTLSLLQDANGNYGALNAANKIAITVALGGSMHPRSWGPTTQVVPIM